MAKHPAKTMLLCATRFWVGASGSFMPLTTPTLRKGVRHVARKQGVSPSELNTAERQLVKEGLLTKPRKGTIALTADGAKKSRATCSGVELPPWNWEASYRDRLDGVRKKARRKHR